MTDLEKLSNKEIRELWKATTERARKEQTEKRENANTEPTDEGYYRDPHGNIVEGKKPLPKTAGHYIDAIGYVQELAPGEKAHALSGNGLVDWINQQDISTDPELQAALGKENLFFEERLTVGESDICLVGKLESSGWKVNSRSQNQNVNLKFRLSRSLTRDEAVEQAVGYVGSKAGPQFKTLSEDEERMIERIAASNRLQAFVLFVQGRLLEDLANRFLELGAAGNELGLQRFAADEKISEIVEEAVAYTFYWNNPRATEEFFEWVRSNDSGRLWSFSLLDSCWSRYQTGSAIERLAQEEPPNSEELDSLSDEQVSDLLTRTRRLKNQAR